jgi:hypothetical protein
MRRKTTGAVGGIIAALLALLGLGASDATVPVVAETRQVTYVTMDGKDIDRISHSGVRVIFKPGSEQTVDHNTTLPVAPIMNWENSDIRNRRQMVFGFDTGVPEHVRSQIRLELDTVFSWYPELPFWREGGTNAPYLIHDRAGQDCSDNNAAGCAWYKGSASTWISYNGDMFRSGVLDLDGVTVAVSHELGHTFNLAHTTCNWPQLTGAQSGMSPIITPSGPACAGARHVLREDYGKAEEYYSIGQAATPTPTPVPTATPTPRPTATPVPAARRVVLYRWIRPDWGESCTATHSGWCRDTEERITPRGAWFQIAIINPDGSEVGPFGFDFVEP